MDFFSNIRILTIPTWVKVSVGLVIIPTLVVSITVIGTSIGDSARADWVEAGAYVLGIVAPIALVVLIFWATDSGVDALRDRTQHVLSELLPEHLLHSFDDDIGLYRYRKSVGARRAPSNKSTLETNLCKDRCYCDYKIVTPPMRPDECRRIVLLRIELNVRKINLNIYFNGALLRGHAGDSVNYTDFVKNKLQHSLAGATSGDTQAHPDDKHPVSATAYEFNDHLFSRELEGQNYKVLVGSISLSSDFLWNPSEKLFYAQDLMLFIRAIVNECPELFEPNHKNSSSEQRL